MGRKLKILVTHPEHWARGYAAEHGAEVVHVDPGGDDSKRLDGGHAGDGIGQLTTPAGVERLQQAASEFKPDIFLFAIHHNFQPWIVDDVRKRSGCKAVMHYTDQREGVPGIVGQYKGLLDLLLVTNLDPTDHQKYVAGGVVPTVQVMLDGVDLDVYNAQRAWQTPPKHDVFFGGHDYHGLIKQFHEQGREPPREISFPGGEFRHRFMKMVNAKYDLIVRGTHGWSSEFNVQPPVYHPHYHGVMIEGAIILSTTNAPRYGLITRRTLRTLASGRMLLVDYLPGTEGVFRNGEHLVMYESLEDGLDKIEFYLKHEDERHRIEANAAELIRKKHSFPCRLRDFLQIAKEAF